MTRNSRSPRARGGPVTFAMIHEAAAGLPGVELGTSYGTPALKARGRLFARLHQSEDALVLRASALDRQILMQSQPGTFYITDHYRDHPWVLVRLSAVAREELPQLLERAWRGVAAKPLIRQRDGGD